jgi:hypothetical protein
LATSGAFGFCASCIEKIRRVALTFLFLFFFSPARVRMPFFDFVFLRETGLNQYKKNANKIFDDKRVQKYFAKMRRKRKKCEKHFFVFL